MIVRLREALGNIAGQAQEAIPRGGIDSLSAHAGFAGALNHPVLDLIGELFCLRIQLIFYVAQLGQPVHRLQGLPPVPDAQDALETHDAACPGAGGHLVDIAAVAGLSAAEGRTRGQPRPGAHDAFAGWHLIAGELDPLVLQQAFHQAGLLFYLRLKKAPFRATLREHKSEA